MGDERWARRTAIVDYGLGLLVIAAGALGALLLLAGIVGRVIIFLLTRP